jgi:hypothetical protein
MTEYVYNTQNSVRITHCHAAEAAQMAACAAQAVADRTVEPGNWAKLVEGLTGTLLPLAAIASAATSGFLDLMKALQCLPKKDAA